MKDNASTKVQKYFYLKHSVSIIIVTVAHFRHKKNVADIHCIQIIVGLNT